MKRQKISKADFIKQHPNLAGPALVQKAKAEGLKLSVNYVYSVRSKLAAAAKGRAARVRTVAEQMTGIEKAQRGPWPVKVAPDNDLAHKAEQNGIAREPERLEEILMAAAAEIGLGRAIRILEDARAKVRKLTGVSS